MGPPVLAGARERAWATHESPLERYQTLIAAVISAVLAVALGQWLL